MTRGLIEDSPVDLLKAIGLRDPMMPAGIGGLRNAAVVDHAALYAGETGHRIAGIAPAGEAVARLAR